MVWYSRLRRMVLFGFDYSRATVSVYVSKRGNGVGGWRASVYVRVLSWEWRTRDVVC